MSTVLGEATVKIGADTSSLKSEIQGAKKEIENFGSSAAKSSESVSGGFKGMLSNALSFASGQAIFNGVGNALGFLKDQLAGCFQESTDAQQGMAQTVAVLKSTGDASGMTADAVANLAGDLSHLTRFSDDTVQSAENMLLTFTNIGKNVFPDATKTVLDMSQALGQDTKSSAIQLGKALNDPISGITALQRVGVTFTTSQKDVIKKLVETGDTAGAQKVILKELQKEFGGTAEAAGKTLPGQLDILKQHFADIRQNIGDALLPELEQFTGYVGTTIMPVIGKFSDWFIKFGVPVIKQFSSILAGDASDAVQGLGSFIADDLLPPAKQIFSVAGDIIDNFVKWNDKTHFLQNTMHDVGALIKLVADDVAIKLMPPIRDAIANFQDWVSNSDIVHDSLSILGTVIDGLSSGIGTLIGWVSDLAGWFGQSQTESVALKDVLFSIGGVIAGIKIIQFGKDIFNAFKDASKNVHDFIDTVGKIKDKVSDVLDFFKGTFSPGASQSLSDISSTAKTTATDTESIGLAAMTSEEDVKQASLWSEADLEGVGLSATTTAGEIEGIGTAALSSEGEVATLGASASTASTGIAGMGTTALGVVGPFALLAGAILGIGYALKTAMDQGSAYAATLNKNVTLDVNDMSTKNITTVDQMRMHLNFSSDGMQKDVSNSFSKMKDQTGRITDQMKQDIATNFNFTAKVGVDDVTRLSSTAAGLFNKMKGDVTASSKETDQNVIDYWNNIASYIDSQSRQAAMKANENFAKIHVPSFNAGTVMRNFNDSSNGYAEGTDNATEGLHWVGERGKELMYFRGGEKVLPHGQSMKLANGSYPSNNVYPSAPLQGSSSGSSGSSKQEIHVHLHLDGQELSYAMVDHMGNALVDRIRAEGPVAA